MMRSSKMIAATGAAGTLLLTLTACDPHQVPEEHSSWELVDTIDLAAIDSSNDIYVEGSFRTSFLGGEGEMESRQVIDYKYAEVVNDDGGIQQKMLSDYFESFPESPYEASADEPTLTSSSGGYDIDYPGADIVTIYQTPDEDQPRIETYFCEVDEDHLDDNRGWWGPPSYYSCEDSYSGGDRDLLIRFEIHVPEGSVVQSFDDESTQEALDE